MYLLGMLQGAVTKHLSLEGQKGFQGSLLSSSMGWDVELGGCSAAARRVLYTASEQCLQASLK